MHPVLNSKLYLVKEHVGLFKAANNYDIYDPDTKQIVLECREAGLRFFVKMFRFSKYKRFTPFDIQIMLPGGQQVVRIKKAFSVFTARVEVMDEENRIIGSVQRKFSFVGSRLSILDVAGNEVWQLKGNWSGWEFKFLDGEREVAQVSKKFAGIGKELFTGADNYALQISDDVPPNDAARQLIMGTVMCIDLILK